jgi:hypothetical protein
MAEFVEAKEPRVIAFEAYLNGESEMAIRVRTHPVGGFTRAG